MSKLLLDFWRDLMYAVRVLAKAPGFTAVGILSLTLGIGVCTVFYSEMNAMVFRPMPAVQKPEELVAIDGMSAYPYFERYRDQRTLTATAAFAGPVPVSLSADGSALRTIRISGHLVSPEYFPVLGVKPAQGRLFREDLDKPGGPPTAVISTRLWRTKFNSDPAIVGRTLQLNGKSVTVAGIAPDKFLGVFPIAPADVFIVVTTGVAVAPELAGDALHRRDLAMFRVFGRLAPHQSMEAAEGALDATRSHLDEEALVPASERKGRRVKLLSASGNMPMPAERKAMTYSFMAVLMGLVLSLACTNLANLLLARAAQRRREVAIRIALGANRWRLVRQLLTESVLLAIGGGAGSLLFTWWLTNLISSMRMPTYTAIEFDVRPDWTVLAVTLVLAVTVGFAFGLMPALASTRPDVAPTLKEGGLSGLRAYRRFGFRNLLVAYQVASSLMLLLIVGYLVIGYHRSSHVDPGFDTARLYLMELDPAHDGYTAEQSTRLLDTLQERLSRLGPVSGVTLADAAPFGDMMAVPNARFSAPQAKGDVQTSVVRQRIGAGYFATLGVPLERGREFTRRDVTEAAGKSDLPALVNQTAARELFAAEDALGRRIRDVRSGANYTVVGVTRDLKSGLFGSATAPTVFVPLAIDSGASAAGDVFTAMNAGASAPAPGATIVARGAAGADVSSAIRREVAAVDPNLTVFHIRTMTEQLDQMSTMIQVASYFYGGLGVFGLILASIGLAGVTAYAVARRSKEIGIRMALGATAGQVLRLVMREGAVLVAVGTVMGFVGATAVSRGLASLTSELARAFGAGASDPLLLVGAPLLLGLLAILACYVPARRAAEIDPLTALRQD